MISRFFKKDDGCATSSSPSDEKTASAASSHTPSPSSIQSPAFEVVSAHLLQNLSNSAAQANHLQDQLLRLRAEFENFRKTQFKEKEEALRYANQGLLTELLPVLDNLELALNAARLGQDTQSIIQGLSMVLSQVERFLQETGVRVVDAKGSSFDPKFHDAVGRKETSEHPEGTILEQHRKGYLLHDRLLRPASVVVAQPLSSAK